jgi:hypothetical protein
VIKRAFWVALGATVGIVAVTQANKLLKKLSPANLAESAAGIPDALTGGLRGFADEVRSAAAEREFELYRVLGVDLPDDGE